MKYVRVKLVGKSIVKAGKDPANLAEFLNDFKTEENSKALDYIKQSFIDDKGGLGGKALSVVTIPEFKQWVNKESSRWAKSPKLKVVHKVMQSLKKTLKEY